MTTRISRRALACALFATTALASPALAQTVITMPAAAIHESVDGNGVDLATGTFELVQPSVSVGGEGLNGLVYTRVGERNNLEGSVSGTTSNPVISIGDQAESFTLTGGVYVSDQGSGATLTYAGGMWTYTSRDGTVAKFGDVQGTYWHQPSIIAWALSVAFPDGTTREFHYRTDYFCASGEEPGCPGGWFYATRLRSVTSNRGYQIKVQYATDTLGSSFDVDPWSRVAKVTAINTTVEACSPTADQCTLTNPWPSLTDGVSGSTQTVTNSNSGVTRYTYSAGQLTGIKSPANSSDNVTIAYASGKVASVNRGGQTWTYAYADNSPASGQRTTTVTNPLSQATSYVTDLTSRLLLSVTDALGRTTAYQYDSKQRPTRVTAPEGNYSQLTYDARGNVTETRAVAKAGSGAADIATTASFASTCSNAKTCNQPVSTTDARGNTTDYTYDSAHGGVLTVTAPAPTGGAARPQTGYSYTTVSFGGAQNLYLPGTVSTCSAGTAPSCVGTADESRTVIAYAATPSTNNYLPVSVTRRDGTGSLAATSAFTYDIVRNLLTVDGPLSGTADTARLRYDILRRRIGETGPDPDGVGSLNHRAVRYTYDADGRATAVARGTVTSQSDTAWSAISVLETVTNVFDNPTGRLLRSSLSAGGTTYALAQTSYDGAGRPECVATRMNPAVFGSLPTSACTLGTQGSHGPDRIRKTVYDAAGQVTQLQVGVGTADAGTERTLSYTNNGQLATLTDAEVNKTTYEYDGHDRLLKARFPLPTKGSNASSTTDYEQLSYDANSNVTSRRLRDANSIAFTYDALNRPTLKDLPGSEPDVTYAYDNLGRPTSASQTGNSLSFTYDALGRNLTQVGPQGTVSSQWDLAGRRTRLTYPGTGLYVDYDYLVTGEMTKIRENGATSGVGVLATFGYDNLGRRTAITRGNGTATSYTYDPVSRLASLINDLSGTTNDLTIGSMSYNPASQIIGQTRSNDTYAWTGHGTGSTGSVADGLNRLTSIGGSATSHDARGNLTGDPITGKTFGYSSENLLTSASGGVTLAYDPTMRLHQVAGAATTRFAYDGLDMIAEYDGSSVLQRRFVHGPRGDEPLVQYEGSGTSDRRFLHADERGSIIATSDNSGAMLTINRYDEFGKPQSGNAGRFQYTSQAWMPELGLYYYKARMYAPHLPRFLQPDPIGYQDSSNLYAYVGNDPVNLTDPLGLEGREFSSELLRSRILIEGSSYVGSISFGQNVCVRYCDNPPSGYDFNGDGAVDVFAPPQYAWLSNSFVGAMGGGFGSWSATGGGRGGELGSGGGTPASSENAKRCIPLSAGPVLTKSGSFTMTMILGGSLSVGTFEIRSIGAHGWFSSGSANAGWEGFVGGVLGKHNTVSDFLGQGGTISIGGRQIVGGSYSFSNGQLTGASVSVGAGGGASVSYGGTHIISSNLPLCGE